MPGTGGWGLLIVDVQRDFCVGGALEVPDGDRVLVPLNQLTAVFCRAHRPVYLSRDWHPAQSSHFSAQGGPWPVHCVAGSPGADFHPDLDVPAGGVIISKGQAPDADGYSAFEGQTPTGLRLERELDDRGVTRLAVGGLATDYCVRQSVLDACRLGLGVWVVTDAIAGVDLEDGDSRRALSAMHAAGARLGSSAEIQGLLEDSPAAAD